MFSDKRSEEEDKIRSRDLDKMRLDKISETMPRLMRRNIRGHICDMIPQPTTEV